MTYLLDEYNISQFSVKSFLFILAGSDGIIKQLGQFVRTKSDSGKKLSDAEILQQIKVSSFALYYYFLSSC